jgi:hypothetical protein
MIKAVSISETSVSFCEATRLNIPEDTLSSVLWSLTPLTFLHAKTTSVDILCKMIILPIALYGCVKHGLFERTHIASASKVLKKLLGLQKDEVV